MTWTATKIFFKKAYAWCVQHWRWIIFAAIALIAYLTGRKNARGLWLQAELARKQYKAEAAAIEKAHSDKSKKVKKIEKTHERDLKKIDKEKERKEKELEEKKLRTLSKIAKDQNAIDDALKDSGIDEV